MTMITSLTFLVNDSRRKGQQPSCYLSLGSDAYLHLEGNLVTLGTPWSSLKGYWWAEKCHPVGFSEPFSASACRANAFQMHPESGLCVSALARGVSCALGTLNSHSNPPEGENSHWSGPLKGRWQCPCQITPALHPECPTCLPRHPCHQGRSPALHQDLIHFPMEGFVGAASGSLSVGWWE